MNMSKFKIGDILVVSLSGNKSDIGVIGKVTEITGGDYYILDSNPNIVFKENCLRKANGTELIKMERIRQIEVEGWTDEHDAVYREEQLALAAASYALPQYSRDALSRKYPIHEDAPVTWPWLEVWWKPTPNNRIRELVKAGALIAAEIDRLQSKSNINNIK